MKKAITILAILAIVVGTVFATTLPADGSKETHQIRLKTLVANVLPQFRLSAAATIDESTTNTAQTNANSADFTKDQAYGTEDANRITVNVQDISINDVDVTFTASLLNAAKTGGKYTLGFTAGSFTNVWKVNPTTGEVSKDNTVAPSTDPAPVLAKATTGVATTGLTISNPTGNTSIDVIFNGQACTAGALATYRVVYGHDTTIIDNDSVGYVADVTMTITLDY